MSRSSVLLDDASRCRVCPISRRDIDSKPRRSAEIVARVVFPIFVERVIMGVIGGFAKESPTDGRRGAALDIIVQLTLNGLAVGCIYGLVALGFVLIYKATELVNFAQGDLLMLGAFIAYMAVVLWGLDYWVGFLIAVAVIAAFGAVLDMTVL